MQNSHYQQQSAAPKYPSTDKPAAQADPEMASRKEERMRRRRLEIMKRDAQGDDDGSDGSSLWSGSDDSDNDDESAFDWRMCMDHQIPHTEEQLVWFRLCLYLTSSRQPLSYPEYSMLMSAHRELSQAHSEGEGPKGKRPPAGMIDSSLREWAMRRELARAEQTTGTITMRTSSLLGFALPPNLNLLTIPGKQGPGQGQGQGQSQQGPAPSASQFPQPAGGDQGPPIAPTGAYGYQAPPQMGMSGAGRFTNPPNSARETPMGYSALPPLSPNNGNNYPYTARTVVREYELNQ